MSTDTVNPVNPVNTATVNTTTTFVKKKVALIKKREVVDNSDIIERIDRTRNTHGYPIFNDYLLRKIFSYFEIKDLLNFSTLCWKFRLMITEDLNRSWHYYYLIYMKEAPIQSVIHCFGQYKRRNVFSRSYSIESTGNTTPLRLECVDHALRASHNYMTTYVYPNYAQYYQQMATPLDQTTIKDEDVFCLVDGEWNTPEQFKITRECKYRHALEANYYPLGHRIYATKYDKNVNYYWKLQEVIMDQLNLYISKNNLKSKSTRLKNKIESLQKEKDDIDRVLKLQEIKIQQTAIRTGPAHKMQRFHMFREVYFRKNNQYLGLHQASLLWATMSETEKEKYSDIADIQYQDALKHKEQAKIRY